MWALKRIVRGVIYFTLFMLGLFAILGALFGVMYVMAMGPNWGRVLLALAFLAGVGFEYGDDNHSSGWWPW